MKLYYMPGACSLAPHITLEWIGQPFELGRVELGKTRDPEYLAVNPLGKVPALIEEDGRIMVEAGAILQYLTEKYPDANLGAGPTLEDRYEMNYWLSHFGGNVHPAFFPFFVPQRYVKSSDSEVQSLAREAGTELIYSQLEFLENHMEGRDYVIGNRRTIADPYLFVFLRWSNHLPKPLSEYPNLNRFLHKMAEDEGVQRALKEQRIGL